PSLARDILTSRQGLWTSSAGLGAPLVSMAPAGGAGGLPIGRFHVPSKSADSLDTSYRHNASPAASNRSRPVSIRVAGRSSASDKMGSSGSPSASPSGRSSPRRRGRSSTVLSPEYSLDDSDREGAFSPVASASMSLRASWQEPRCSPSATSGHSQVQPQLDEATGFSRTSYDRNVTRTNMQKFELDRREACAWVRTGELLVKHPLRRPDGGRFSSLKEMRRKPHVLLQRERKYMFVVIDRHRTASGHPELRWDRDLARAVAPQAKGSLVLSEVHYIAATVLDEPDGPEVSQKLLNEFQIVCSSYSMKLVAPSRQSMKLWVVGLLQLSQLARKRNTKFMRTKVDDVLWSTIVREFRRLDQDKSGDISLAELTDLIPAAGGNSNAVGEVLSEFDADGNGVLQLQEFARLFQALAVKEVLAPWFLKYARPVVTDLGMQTNGISTDCYLQFLEHEQCETGETGAVFGDLQDPYVVSVEGRPHLTEQGFSYLLCSSKNPAFDPARRQRVHQDMTRPISHYWVSSSHNTYLQSDQLFGKSTLEQYIDVLLRGCRCVEIDCWDGDDGEPIVTHGYTATSRLMFQDVVRVCRDYGFVASQYPLTLSLEVHCGSKQLARMGQILNDILGDQLLRLPDSGLANAELVSPAAAMRRVIVKGKVPHEIIAEDGTETTTTTNIRASSVASRSTASIRAASHSPKRRMSWPFSRCLGTLSRRLRVIS
ncbi:unnamed protein product, partial [Prorocentrum cordatum]